MSDALQLAFEVLTEDRAALIECHAIPAGSAEIPKHDRSAIAALARYDASIAAIRTALSQPPAAPPSVPWVGSGPEGSVVCRSCGKPPMTQRSTPTQAERQPLVKRLRAYVESTDYMNAEGLCAEAADEIARLREHAVILAETARQVERERCAKLCEYKGPELLRWWGDGQANAACQECATAIRGPNVGGEA